VKTISRIATVLALATTAVAVADRRIDNASTAQRNNTFWSETESGGTTPSRQGKCVVEQVGGKIRINALGGRGGSAAYRSRWLNDWSDGFTVAYKAEFRSGTPATESQSARTGIALGFGTFSSASGYQDGINVQLSRTRSVGRRLQIVARQAGVETVLQSAYIAAGEHQYRLSWQSVGSTITLQVFVDGSATPLLSASGLESRFAGMTASGMGVALFGSSAGNFKFENMFDNVKVSGDDHDDSDDNGWDDNDGIDDDDEDGIRGNEQLTFAAFDAKFQQAVAANAANGSTVLKAESEDGGVEVLFMETETTVRTVRVLASGAAIVSEPRNADVKELEAIAVSGLVTKSLTDALAEATALHPDALIHEVSLDEEHGAPIWEVELVSSANLPIEIDVAAN